MNGVAQAWWNAISGFPLAALEVLRGHFAPLPLLAAADIVCLLTGVILLLAWRVKHATRVLWLVAAAALSPVAVYFSNSILGWVGMLFAVLAGALFLGIGTTVFANGADRRLPVWLIGLFSISLATYCASVGGAFDSLIL
jgi:hypothetical protein